MILLTLLAGCKNDNGLQEISYDAIAVVLGDFDNVGDTLTASTIGWTAYDGFIVQATYEPEDERQQRGGMALTVEGLLTDTVGELDLDGYNAVFVNSGTRGLNRVQYNDALAADDTLLQDADNLQKTCDFVEGGGTLVVSDWAYDLVQFCWPDAVDFAGDAAVVDGAQLGVAETGVLATVKDTVLTQEVGPVVTVDYNYTAWAVIEGVAADTEVLMTGDVQYQPSAEELYEDLADAPLLVRFHPNRGQVIFSTFHWGAQSPSLTQSLLLGAVDGLNPGDGSESATAAGEGSDSAS